MRGFLAALINHQQWRRVAASALWGGFALVFVVLAIETHTLAATRLPRAGFRFPPTHNYRTQPSRIPEVLNEMAIQYDTSIGALEQSLRSAARTRFWLDLAAATICLSTVGVRWAMGRGQTANAVWDVPVKTQRAQRPRSSVRAPDSTPPAVVEPHEGSFPSGGYAC